MTVTMEPHAVTGAGAGGVLERRYRRLLLSYPPAYRAGYGGELIATLLDTAEPGRTVPSFRESRALIVAGLRTRVIYMTERPAWIDGIHLGVLALSVTQLAMLVPYAMTVPLWVGLSALAVLLIMRGRVRLALPVVTLVAVKVCAITLGRPFLDQTLLPAYPDRFWNGLAFYGSGDPALHDSGDPALYGGGGPALYGGGGPVAPMVGYALLVLGLLMLTVHERRLGKRSWFWLPAIPLLAGANPAGLDFSAGTDPLDMTRVGLEIGVLLFAVWAGHVAHDLRWATAAGIYLVSVCTVYAENLGAHSEQDLAHLALLTFLTVLAAAVPYRAKRHVVL
ncbi:hypothetical protein [Streptosporangium sp. NPDC000396]|uniref:hypothetical protein n=1 Tax=Streptosporangium sp. NPDC000396 TaxID=3366185 RepID=UPI0036992774